LFITFRVGKGEEGLAVVYVYLLVCFFG